MNVIWMDYLIVKRKYNNKQFTIYEMSEVFSRYGKII